MKKGLNVLYLFLFVQLFLWISTPRLAYPKIIPESISFSQAFKYINFTQITSSFVTSIQIAFICILFSILFCLPTSLFLAKLKGRTKFILSTLLYIPILAPLLLPSIGLYELMYQMNLIGSVYGIALAQCCVLYPYMLKPIEDYLSSEGFKPEITATSFGASKIEAFYKVTIPRIMLPLIQGSFFVFVGSFNDYIISFLLGDFQIKTLSVILYPLMQSDNRVTTTMIIAIYTLPLIIFYLLLKKSFKWRSNVKDK